MAGSANQFAYQFGVTQLTIGASLAIGVTLPRCCLGWQVGWLSGGTMSFVNAATLSPGYIVGTTEVVCSDGPAQFFLGAASGTTAIARVIFKYSAGFSSSP
jgi:hypothetical protein